MGTPEFAAPSLKSLLEGGEEVLAVVTQPDRPRGRGRKMAPPPVKEVALNYDVPVLQPLRASDEEFCLEIRALDPDLLFVVAFGQILKKSLLDIPSWGVLNIHASLLPRYRGAAPIHWAVLNGEVRTGLTAMKMDEGLDTGPVLYQEETKILENETAGELHDRLAEMSGEFADKVLGLLKENRVEEKPQDDSRASYAPKIDRNMSKIDWSLPGEVISAFIRGLDPWPGAFSSIAGREVKLFTPRFRKEEQRMPLPGKVRGFSDNLMEVEVKDGVLGIRELQVGGKKRLPAGEFQRGFRIKEGAVFEG